MTNTNSMTRAVRASLDILNDPAEQRLAMTLEYSSRRSRLNWLSCSSILAAIALLHFACSLALWCIWFSGRLRNPSVPRDVWFSELRDQLLFFLPAVFLFATSAAACWFALHRRAAAKRLLIVTVLAA